VEIKVNLLNISLYLSCIFTRALAYPFTIIKF
jgi:hypothetical protein